MAREIINKELAVTVPEGFTVLDAAQLKELYRDDNPDRWGARNEDKHITLAVFYHKSGGLLSTIAGLKDVVKGTETKLKKGLSANGYKKIGEISETLGGLPAMGFTYTYAVQGIDQLGEVYTIKKDKVVYTVYTYTRPELEEASKPVIREFLDSFAFGAGGGSW